MDNEDLGKAFFENLTDQSGTKLIDFKNFTNNRFHEHDLRAKVASDSDTLQEAATGEHIHQQK